ncbi:hypothetical protein [Kribbella sp. CA-247076]|uniref:hypothetical protein n=1 Tax=Kribbella sp. CA-247076 TaxID=3239941 RepID=UPI003D93817D
MTASTVAVGGLIDAGRELMPVLAEHLQDNEGELLPPLVMADVVRWLVGHRKTDPEICQSVLDWLEREYARGPEGVCGLIAVNGSR